MRLGQLLSEQHRQPIAAEELPYGSSPADAGEQLVAFDGEHRLLRRRGRGDRAATVEGVLEDLGPAVVVGEHGVELDELEAEPSEIRLVAAVGDEVVQVPERRLAAGEDEGAK